MSPKHKILIVDDEPDVLDYLIAVFEDHGYGVVSAPGGTEAYELASSIKPDLITLDITMPGQSGVKTYRNIKNDPELKDIPIIVVTATVNSPQSFMDLLNEFPGPEGFLNKPVNTEELIQITETLLADKTA